MLFYLFKRMSIQMDDKHLKRCSDLQVREPQIKATRYISQAEKTMEKTNYISYQWGSRKRVALSCWWRWEFLQLFWPHLFKLKHADYLKLLYNVWYASNNEGNKIYANYKNYDKISIQEPTSSLRIGSSSPLLLNPLASYSPDNHNLIFLLCSIKNS